MVVIRIQIHFGSSFFVVLKNYIESHQNLFWTHRRMSHDAKPQVQPYAQISLDLLILYLVGVGTYLRKTPIITRHNLVKWVII